MPVEFEWVQITDRRKNFLRSSFRKRVPHVLLHVSPAPRFSKHMLGKFTCQHPEVNTLSLTVFANLIDWPFFQNSTKAIHN